MNWLHPAILRGFVVNDRNGSVFVRGEETDPLTCVIRAWPSRDDRRLFELVVSKLAMSKEKDPEKESIEYCRIAVEQANWMPSVWCAEWCPRDSFDYCPAPYRYLGFGYDRR